MSTITLRATKGSPLTNTEVDNNFSNLNSDKLEATYAGAMNSLTGGTSIVTVGTISTGTWSATTITPAKGGTGVANGSNNTITFTGNYTLGLTLSANTSVTLPTTGTLATLAGTESLTNKTLGSGSTWNGNTVAYNYGGTGLTSFTSGGAVYATSTSALTTGTLPVASGGTGVTTSTGSGNVVLSTSPTLTTPVLGVASGTSLTLSSLTAGRVTFAGTSGLLSDSTGMVFDSTNKVLIIGSNSALGGTTNPILGLTGGANNYIQGYIYNTTNGASSSADLVAYPSNGTDTSGWIDMGITSATYSQATFSVTGANEGYLFMSAPSGSSTSGNLVIATDSTGTANAIQFYTGGFNATKTAPKMALLSSGALAFGSMTGYGSSGQILVSAGNAAPVWTTPTYASTGKAIAMAMVFGG